MQQYLDMNIQVSKSYKDIIDVFGGLSYETISIASSYTYVLPVENQCNLALAPAAGRYTPFRTIGMHFGDMAPQTATYDLSDSNIKVVLGVAKQV